MKTSLNLGKNNHRKMNLSRNEKLEPIFSGQKLSILIEMENYKNSFVYKSQSKPTPAPTPDSLNVKHPNLKRQINNLK
jgi:hypothetical protein